MIDVVVTEPQAVISQERCPEDGAGVEFTGELVSGGREPGVVPSGFRATTVVRCVIDPNSKVRVDGDRWHYRLDEQTGPSTAALLEALSLPDRQFPPGTGHACAAGQGPRPYLLLTDADGRTVRPRFPIAEPCSTARPEVSDAISRLSLTNTRSFRVTLDHKGR